MGLFKRRAPAPVMAKAPDHAVIVHFALNGGDYGTEAQREALFALEDRLIQAIDAAGAGEFDGNEFGGGEAVLYAYGPDASVLYAAMEPHLRDCEPRPAFAILRFGDVSDPEATQQRLDF